MLYDETNNKYDLDYNEIYDYEYDIDKIVNKNSYKDVDINIDSINFNRDNNLYSPMEGFNKGNMFKNLYSKYKNHVYKLRVNSKKDELLYNIQMYSFALKDMNLYLDIYPDDKNILNNFHNYRKKYEVLKKQYESEYGPLCMSNTLNTEKWTWIKNPWPWDKGGNN